ncbi:hypothetical protein CEXT_222761 [Caerostris extrusa]|uniref:Uncharacterized protein n=1 Tax=Caerostris extrusa TaxID=172846 RepID=A0AAV4NPR9_CAEEX|nr:hypothetical protein CEXT_222761 [Caerostris extrusa]
MNSFGQEHSLQHSASSDKQSDMSRRSSLLKKILSHSGGNPFNSRTTRVSISQMDNRRKLIHQVGRVESDGKLSVFLFHPHPLSSTDGIKKQP